MNTPPSPVPEPRTAYLRQIEEALICHANFSRGKETTAVVAEKILNQIAPVLSPAPTLADAAARECAELTTMPNHYRSDFSAIILRHLSGHQQAAGVEEFFHCSGCDPSFPCWNTGAACHHPECLEKLAPPTTPYPSAPSPREAIERALDAHIEEHNIVGNRHILIHGLLTALTPLLAPSAFNENAVEQARADKVLGTGFYRDAKPGTFGRGEWLDLLMACQDGRATCMRVLEIIERETVPVAAVDGDRIKSLADAFLSWPLPESVCADLCATKQQTGRIGTNLLSFVEAEQMMREVVLPLLAHDKRGDGERSDKERLEYIIKHSYRPLHTTGIIHFQIGADEYESLIESIDAALAAQTEGKG